MEIARGLATHFNADALERMPGDLREHDLYVAEDGDRVVGFLTIQNVGDRIAEITWMGVPRDLHRRGIGSALVEAAAGAMEDEGYRALQVRTLADTVDYPPYDGTRDFYQALGFELREVIDPYPGWAPGNPCALYRKALGGPEG